MQLQAQECWAATRRAGRILPLEPLELGREGLGVKDFRLWSPELGKDKFLWFSATQFMALLSVNLTYT